MLFRSRTEVSSQNTARIESITVREGDHVQTGQVLVRLRDDEAQASLVQARAALTPLRDKLSGDEALGVQVFYDALSAPLYWIASNAGMVGAVVVNKVSELPACHGFNAATLSYGDLVADGIIDPVKVTRSAVVNAASVARMLLTTETAIVEIGRAHV